MLSQTILAEQLLMILMLLRVGGIAACVLAVCFFLRVVFLNNSLSIPKAKEMLLQQALPILKNAKRKTPSLDLSRMPIPYIHNAQVSENSVLDTAEQTMPELEVAEQAVKPPITPQNIQSTASAEIMSAAQSPETETPATAEVIIRCHTVTRTVIHAAISEEAQELLAQFTVSILENGWNGVPADKTNNTPAHTQ